MRKCWRVGLWIRNIWLDFGTDPDLDQFFALFMIEKWGVLVIKCELRVVDECL